MTTAAPASSSRFVAAYRLARRAYGAYTAQLFWLTALGFVGGFVESVGADALIPLLTLVLGTGGTATDTISLAIGDVFAFLHIPFTAKFLLIFIVALFMVRAVISLALTYIQIAISADYERTTRLNLLSAILYASWPYLLKEKLGALESRLLVDVPGATTLLSRISNGIMLGTSLLMYLAVAFNISLPITLATLVVGAAIVLLFKPLIGRIRAYAIERTMLFREVAHHVAERVGGVKTVKAMGAEGSAVAEGDTLFSRVRDLNVNIAFIHQITVSFILPVGVLYLATIFGLSFKTHIISIAALPAIVYLIYRIFTYIQQSQDNFQSMNEFVPYLESVLAYETSATEAREVRSGTKPFSYKNELAFEQVGFAYGADRTILKDVSFSVPKGSVVGIIGPSGAGKTTTIDLILRLLTPTSGRIALDDVDSREIALDAWRGALGYVAQDFFLERATIAENIRFHDDRITDVDIAEAAKLANLGALLAQSPEGLATLVGDRGLTLSAGERQRLTIARVLARKPQILVLDEATSALDNESEARLQEVVEGLRGRTTVLIVAHRLSTIMAADQLVVLKDGRVAETGAPKDLLADPHSYFSQVAALRN